MPRHARFTFRPKVWTDCTSRGTGAQGRGGRSAVSGAQWHCMAAPVWLLGGLQRLQHALPIASGSSWSGCKPAPRPAAWSSGAPPPFWEPTLFPQGPAGERGLRRRQSGLSGRAPGTDPRGISCASCCSPASNSVPRAARDQVEGPPAHREPTCCEPLSLQPTPSGGSRPALSSLLLASPNDQGLAIELLRPGA